MASEFYNKNVAEERKEWRQHPMTVLAIKMLREYQESCANETFNYVGASGEKLNHVIGVHHGVRECIELLERE